MLPALLTSGCHRTADTPAAVAATVDATVAAAPLDPADPAALSGAAEDFAQIDPTLTFSSNGDEVVAWTSLRPNAPSVVRARISRDGGATWEGTQTLVAPDGRGSSQPALTADADGNVYIAWLGERVHDDGGTEDAHIYVARADAKATSFGPPLEVSDEMHHAAKVHKPWMAVTGAGTVMVTWSYTHPNGDGVGIANTRDGVKWTRGIIIERIDLGARLPYVCTSSHGDRAWLAYLDAEAGVRLRASDDGGDSWAPARVATVSSTEDRPWIAADTPLCDGDGDDVTVAFARTRPVASPPGLDAGVVASARTSMRASPADAGTTKIAAAADAVVRAASSLVVAQSIDGGRTFDIRHTYDAGSQLFIDPQLAREPDGSTDIAFYSSGATADGASLRWLHASEHGLSPARVAREHLRFEPSPVSPAWPGQYFGWAWHDGALFAAPADNAQGKPHVALVRIAAAEARGGAASHEHTAATAP